MISIGKGVSFLLILFILSFVLAITGNVVEGDAPSFVSIDGLRILAETFNGSTTVFEGLGTEDLNNLSNMTLEKTSYGKVIFNENINLTNVAGADRTVNFDLHFNISDNLVYSDGSELPYLNKSVNISIYGLTFSNPQIMKGGSICGDCTEISYSGGTYSFVSEVFEGSYYIRETPTGPICGNGVCESGEDSTSCPADCGTSGGGGGGGGGGTPPTGNETTTSNQDFYVLPDFFVVKMKPGQYTQREINIYNNGTEDLEIFVVPQDIQQFIFPQVNSFNLKRGENYTLRLNIYFSKSGKTDVYIGKILFKTNEIERESRVILDVNDPSALFDIRTDVLKRYVYPGGRIRANVTIINMGDLSDLFDVSLEYQILDFGNNQYNVKKEDFAMNRTYYNIFSLYVPKGIPTGDYVFYTRVSKGEIDASSYDTFSVERVSLWIWIIVIILILFLIFLILFKLNKKKDKERLLKIKPNRFFRRRRVRIPRLPQGI